MPLPRERVHTQIQRHMQTHRYTGAHTLTRAHSLAYKALSEGTIVLPKERDSEL